MSVCRPSVASASCAEAAKQTFVELLGSGLAKESCNQTTSRASRMRANPSTTLWVIGLIYLFCQPVMCNACKHFFQAVLRLYKCDTRAACTRPTQWHSMCHEVIRYQQVSCVCIVSASSLPSTSMSSCVRSCWLHNDLICSDALC